MRVHKENRIECTPERLFEIMFDPEVERRMNMEAMKSEDVQLLDRSVDGPTWRMRCRITPQDNMPGFIKKLVGGAFTMEEERTHQQGTDRAKGVITPSAMRDKVRMSYEMRVVPDGAGACVRHMDWEIEVKIFGIGGQIEKFAMGEIERSIEASARFLNDFARQQKSA